MGRASPCGRSEHKRAGAPPLQAPPRRATTRGCFSPCHAICLPLAPWQANFHTTLSGDAMVSLIYHKKLNDEWKEVSRLEKVS